MRFPARAFPLSMVLRERLRRFGKSRAVRVIVLLVLSVAAGALWASRIIVAQASPFVSDQLARLPHAKVGLLLGCSERLNDGRPNLFFQRRIAAAVELFRAGKIDYLLVSGDNSRADYDEPGDMRRALVAAGVPSSRIVRDSAGFRTLDSVVRAKEVFGLRRFTIISQRFHDLRAVYLARRRGIEAYGFAAADVGGAEGLRVSARELVSRLFALLDVSLRTRPRYSGPVENPPFAEH
jgi:SanA protein